MFWKPPTTPGQFMRSGIFTLLIGCVWVGIGFYNMVWLIRAQAWLPVAATVNGSSVKYGSKGSKSVDVFYRYEWEGQMYPGSRFTPGVNLGGGGQNDDPAAWVEAHPKGTHLTVYVDPSNPYRAAVIRDVRFPDVIVLLFPFAFIAVGLGWIMRGQGQPPMGIFSTLLTLSAGWAFVGLVLVLLARGLSLAVAACVLGYLVGCLLVAAFCWYRMAGCPAPTA